MKRKHILMCFSRNYAARTGSRFWITPCGSLSLSLFYTQTQLSYLWQHFRSSIISHYPQFQSNFQPQTQTLGWLKNIFVASFQTGFSTYTFFFWIQVETYSHRRDRIYQYLNQRQDLIAWITLFHNMTCYIISVSHTFKIFCVWSDSFKSWAIKLNYYFSTPILIFPSASSQWNQPCISSAHWRPKAAMRKLKPTPPKLYRLRNVMRKPNPTNIITWTSWKPNRKMWLEEQYRIEVEKRKGMVVGTAWWHSGYNVFTFKLMLWIVTYSLPTHN